MTPHNYQMKFNGSNNRLMQDQNEYYSMFNGSTMKKSVSFIPRFLGRVRAIFNKTNRHYEGAQKTPEHLFNPSETWRDTGTL